MSETLVRVRKLVEERAVRISAHAYEELRNDEIRARDVFLGLAQAQVVEDSPDYYAGERSELEVNSYSAACFAALPCADTR